ncbi:MAG: hypothetical protein DLM60_05930 [Pseudonocardiales bacterium]|nr:MAG: hypothetical protein DLM60_05930 [Pseudonocardiales bacterium]
MLDFFSPSPHASRIDPVYWVEKLIPGGRDSAKEYAPEQATAFIRQTVAEHADEHPLLAEDVERQLFDTWGEADLSTESGLREAIGRFEGAYQDFYEGFRFPFQEWDLHRYGQWFLLSCEVLPWAVEQYDAALAPVG